MRRTHVDARSLSYAGAQATTATQEAGWASSRPGGAGGGNSQEGLTAHRIFIAACAKQPIRQSEHCLCMHPPCFLQDACTEVTASSRLVHVMQTVIVQRPVSYDS